MASTRHDSSSIFFQRIVPDRAKSSRHGKRALIAAAASVAMLMLVAGRAGAVSDKDRLDELFDDDKKPWSEVAIALPPLPEPANLLPFDVSTTATQQFAIDAKSLSVGADGVVRYTLVAISSSGAKNISHEGIRCAANERKFYALGHADGTWSRARRDQWEPIINNTVNRQQAALSEDYFCMGTAVAGSAADMLRRLRQRQPINSGLFR